MLSDDEILKVAKEFGQDSIDDCTIYFARRIAEMEREFFNEP